MTYTQQLIVRRHPRRPRGRFVRGWAALLLLAGGFAGGCDRQQPKTGLATSPIRIGSKTFTLELALDSESHQKGLMFRDSMPADHGMFFAFPEEGMLSFYMKNTRIPLDILYLDAGGRVVSIRQMQPYVLASVPSDRPAKYAIELNQGAAADAGAKEGDVLQIPSEARGTRE